jgi:hypothetical protein
MSIPPAFRMQLGACEGSAAPGGACGVEKAVRRAATAGAPLKVAWHSEAHSAPRSEQAGTSVARRGVRFRAQKVRASAAASTCASMPPVALAALPTFSRLPRFPRAPSRFGFVP